MDVHNGFSDEVGYGYYSKIATFLLCLILIGAAALPNLPGFGDRVSLTKPLYIFPFSIIRVIICSYLAILAALFARLLFYALQGRPAVILNGDKVLIRGIFTRNFQVSEVIKTELMASNFVIVLQSGKSARLPLFLIKDEKILNRLSDDLRLGLSNRS